MLSFKQIRFSKKELHLLYRLREFGRLNFNFPPKWGTMDYDLIYAKIIIDDEKKLIIATFDDEVTDVLTRGLGIKRRFADISKTLSSKVQLHKGDKWDEQLGIQLAKAQLLRNYTAYISSKIGNIAIFLKKWCLEANEATSLAREHNNRISAILNKRLQELNKKEKKHAGIKRNASRCKSASVKGGRHTKQIWTRHRKRR